MIMPGNPKPEKYCIIVSIKNEAGIIDVKNA